MSPKRRKPTIKRAKEEECVVQWDDKTENIVYIKEIENVDKKTTLSVGSKIKMLYKKKWYYGKIIEMTNKSEQSVQDTKQEQNEPEIEHKDDHTQQEIKQQYGPTEDTNKSSSPEDYSPADDTDNDPTYEQHCEASGCTGDVWAACENCSAFMCFTHFKVCGSLDCLKGHSVEKLKKKPPKQGQGLQSLSHEQMESKSQTGHQHSSNTKDVTDEFESVSVEETNQLSRTLGTQTKPTMTENRSTQTYSSKQVLPEEQENLSSPTKHSGRGQSPSSRTSEQREDVYQATRDSVAVALWATTGSTDIEGRAKNKKNRQQYCIYCKKALFNLPRHLLKVHGDQAQVIEYKRLRDLGDKRMMDVLGKIRREGNAMKNKILQNLGKPLQPVRITKNQDPSSKRACPNCGAYYQKRTLYRHYKSCSGKPVKKNFSSIIEGRKKLNEAKNVPVTISQEMKTIIIPGMRIGQENDAVDDIINDEDLIALGNSLCLKFGHELETQKKLIRRKLRAMANLRVTMARKDPSVKYVRDIFDTDKWDTYISSVQDLAKLKSKDETRCSPNVVNEIGQLSTNVARNVKVSLPKTAKGEAMKKSIENWLDRHEVQFSTTIGYHARKLAEKKQWQNRKYEPLTGDIIKLNVYLRDTIKKALEVLKKDFNKKQWDELSKACMLLLLSFNRKRVGEVQNMRVADFTRKEKVRENTDVYESLEPSEKILAGHFFHVLIRGKLARGVPILIEDGIAKAIDVLISFREAAGVAPTNTFLFAKGDGSNKMFDGNLCLADAAENCGADVPGSITSTNLRKHLASVAQALNMTEHDLKTLSGFLGHTTKTHLEHYRLPSDALHTAKLSKLLLALDEGTIAKYRGKSIEEIDVPSTVGELEEEIVLTPGKSPKTLKEQTRKHSPSKLVKSVAPMKISRSPKKSPKKSPEPLRKRWTTKEITAMRSEFADFLTEEKLPGTEFCREVKKRCEELRERKIRLLRAWINNEIVRQRKLRRRQLFVNN